MRSYESQTAGGDRRLPLVMQHPVADAARYIHTASARTTRVRIGVARR
jgi:hypothetical protein